MANLSNKTKLSLFRRMLKIREFEEKIVEVYPEQQMRCPVHLSIGQEATSAGMCEALSPKDIIFGNHRSHGHYVGKGGNLRKMMAEMHGKATGCCNGVGGSMHLVDLEAGIVATTPIVGGTIPVAVGAALANQMKASDIVTTLFLGDGALEEGVFHESLSFAILKKLPVIFFCENNFYSVYTPLDTRQPKRGLSQMVGGHGIPTKLIDGNDVMEVYRTAKLAYDYVKAGNGPYFIEATTYRWREHCGPNFDNHIGYRTEEEFLVWKDKCPVARMKHHLISKGIATEQELETMREELCAEIDDAINFAKSSPFPTKDRLFDHVYAE